MLKVPASKAIPNRKGPTTHLCEPGEQGRLADARVTDQHHLGGGIRFWSRRVGVIEKWTHRTEQGVRARGPIKKKRTIALRQSNKPPTPANLEEIVVVLRPLIALRRHIRLCVCVCVCVCLLSLEPRRAALRRRQANTGGLAWPVTPRENPQKE